MTEPEIASYVEIYPCVQGLVVEVYLTKEDFQRAAKGGLSLPADTSAPCAGVARVEVFQTVPALRPKRLSAAAPVGRDTDPFEAANSQKNQLTGS